MKARIKQGSADAWWHDEVVKPNLQTIPQFYRAYCDKMRMLEGEWMDFNESGSSRIMLRYAQPMTELVGFDIKKKYVEFEG
jgi:hypothetical protein